MPGILPDPDRSFTRLMANGVAWQKKSGQQQNRTIANGRGEVVLNIGLVPTGVNGPPPACSTGQYAIQFLVPTKTTQNRQLLVVGQQSDGTYGMWLYKGTGPATHTEVPLAKFTGTGVTLFSSAGDKLIQLADTGLTLYSAAGDKLIQLDDTGLFLTNAAGTVLCKLIDTGLWVKGPSGLGHTRVTPPSESFVDTELTTDATSYTTLGGPSVTVTVSAAGRALVMPSTIIGIDGGTTSAYWQGLVAVAVDGGTPTTLLGASSGHLTTNAQVAPIEITSSNSYLWSGLSSGSHTFKMLFRSANGQTVHFTGNSLVVIPY